RSRHRHRTHARAVRAARRARARPRSLPRYAGARAHAARSRRAQALQRAPGRHLRPRAAEGCLRRRRHPSGAALSRRWRARDHGGGARAAPGRPSLGRRLRPARPRIPARRARPSPSRLCRRHRGAMDESRPPRGRAPAQSRARARLRGEDRGLALARAGCSRGAGHPGRARRPGPARGAAMSGEPRASRFVHGAGPHAGKERRIRVSFEFFPPETEGKEKTLWDSSTRLAALEPTFVSVTYGAGGSTRERTHATVKRILAETALVPAAHLTCVAATCEEIDGVIRNYCAAGVRHIVALRGDPVGGIDERYAPHPGGYRHAADLVAGIKRLSHGEVSVSAYPAEQPDS